MVGGEYIEVMSPRETVVKIIDHVKENFSEYQRKMENQEDEWQKKVLKYRF